MATTPHVRFLGQALRQARTSSPLADAQHMPANGARKPGRAVACDAPSTAQCSENGAATPLRQIEDGDPSERGGIADEPPNRAKIHIEQCPSRPRPRAQRRRRAASGCGTQAERSCRRRNAVGVGAHERRESLAIGRLGDTAQQRARGKETEHTFGARSQAPEATRIDDCQRRELLRGGQGATAMQRARRDVELDQTRRLAFVEGDENERMRNVTTLEDRTEVVPRCPGRERVPDRGPLRVWRERVDVPGAVDG